MNASDFFWIPLMRTGLAVRSNILNEHQAVRNHGQTLRRLTERGGLSPCEALAIVERRDWHRHDDAVDAVKLLAALPTSNEADALRGLLDEVRQCFTRDDDLPEGLMTRIDLALALKGDAR